MQHDNKKVRKNANKSFGILSIGILSYHFLFYLVVIVLRLVTFLERQPFNSSKLVEFCLNFLGFRRACHDEVPTGLRSSSSFALHVRPGPSWEVRCLIVSQRGSSHLNVAGKSNLMTRLQLRTSRPSSMTFVDTTVFVSPERNLSNKLNIQRKNSIYLLRVFSSFCRSFCISSLCLGSWQKAIILDSGTNLTFTFNPLPGE